MSHPYPKDIQLELFCLVDGAPLSRAFSVEIDSTANVDQLKDAIKTKKSNFFKDVDANNLTLWRVSIPYSDDETPLGLDSVNDKKKLGHVHKLSKVFNRMPEEDTIHIIVQRPPSESKRHRDEDSAERYLKRFKPNATVCKAFRKYVYYADQTRSNEPLVAAIGRGEYVRVYGARASGKSSRIMDAMDTLNKDGYECVYVDFQFIDISSEKSLWEGLNQTLKRYKLPCEFNNGVGFYNAFSTDYRRWNRPVVIFFDEFDKLRQDDASAACSSMLATIRGIRNDPARTQEKPESRIHSIIAIGTYAILMLNRSHPELSPFNISDNFRNKGLTEEQVRELYYEFAKDRNMTIDDRVIEDIHQKTNGHAGLVNVCGVALEEKLVSLDRRQIIMDHWGCVQNMLLSRMKKYGTFQKLIDDLIGRSEKQVSALARYRTHYLGNPSEVTIEIQPGESGNLEEYLAALGVLQPEADGFKIASPLMDSFLRQMVIPQAYPTAPDFAPPMKPSGLLDILEVVKSALLLFDKGIIARACALSYKVAFVPVNNQRNQRVPRESVYDSEMIRICSNWLSRINYQVLGQHHVGRLCCDIVLRDRDLYSYVLELVVTETVQQIQQHIERTVNYKNSIGAHEGWVIHFTRQDNYLQNPHWPAEEILEEGIYMMHIWHDENFKDVRLSAKWKDSDGHTITIEDERVI
ncbi:hypothetical protein DFQ28_001499 [Apophysomyces sp. BC1034]|nr:hypothetical protein DFQ30_008834 [Apophysomyces sp. BC1015]KAG0180263.1 hypothetical protein DFQ29_000960 [Apophysomyces sp. BC1021]KAG0190802.1 hypothetical protein DFQ28_001499 [Apophysomyces sp. BC1034]